MNLMVCMMKSGAEELYIVLSQDKPNSALMSDRVGGTKRMSGLILVDKVCSPKKRS
jgi:hypothetical protein